MSDLRKAAAMALYALELECTSPPISETEVAMAMLKDALAQSGEKFCDTHCTWRDHYPDCALRTEAAEEANRRANAGWELMCKKMVAVERERCCRIIFGLCVSDNNAQEIVNAIRGVE
jgi:hypothetical protein